MERFRRRQERPRGRVAKTASEHLAPFLLRPQNCRGSKGVVVPARCLAVHPASRTLPSATCCRPARPQADALVRRNPALTHCRRQCVDASRHIALRCARGGPPGLDSAQGAWTRCRPIGDHSWPDDPPGNCRPQTENGTQPCDWVPPSASADASPRLKHCARLIPSPPPTRNIILRRDG